MPPELTLHPGAALAVLDDPVEQAAFTSWQQDAAGQRTALSHFQLSGLYCAACAGLIENALRAEPGVLDATVHYGSQRASVRWQPALVRPSQLIAAVARAGYAAAPDVAEFLRCLSDLCLLEPAPAADEFIDRQREQRRCLVAAVQRAKYDAQSALDALSRTLGHQVDLDSVQREVIAAVTSTVRPAHVGLWLRTERGVSHAMTPALVTIPERSPGTTERT
jgi:cation transport ATPase